MVTIIIPTYKRATYIERAIQSILNQTYDDYEIIVVDDNNPETEDRKNMEQIMEKYKNNPKIKYLQHEKNKNGAVARNTGIKEAKGEYITFLDDDDFFLKDRLKIMVEALEKNKDYNAAYSSSLLKEGKYFYKLISANEAGNFEKEILKANSIMGTGSNLFFRAKTLKELKGFNEQFLRHQDYEIMVRFFNMGNKLFNIDNLLVVKDNSNGINVPNSEKALQYREQYLECFKENILKYDDSNEIYIKNYKDLLYITLQENNSKQLDVIYEKIKRYSDDEKKIDKYIKKIKIKQCFKRIKVFNKMIFLIKCYKTSKRIPKDIMKEIKIIENYK